MKKNIEYASLSTLMLEHLINTLDLDLDGADELKKQFQDLESGRCSSLILEASDGSNSNMYSDVICCDELEIVPKYRKVVVAAEEVMLTPKEYDILYFLASNRGEIFTKEQIYQAVWEEEYLMDDSNIMAFIRKLRKKIEPNPDNPKFILTVWGIGYKFSDK